MKEIIYLDTNIMNSTLAQLNKGLITSYSSEESSSETLGDGQQSTKTTSTGLNAKFVFGTDLLRTSSEMEQTSKSILEGQRDLLNKAFHDYALEILIQDLNDHDLIKNNENRIQGDFQLMESNYKFYDFELIHNLSDSNSFSTLMDFVTDDEKKKQIDNARKIINKSKSKQTFNDRSKFEELESLLKTVDQPIKSLQMMEHISGFISKAMKGLIIIKLGKSVALAKRDFLRESSESISFRIDQSRKVKVLSRIIGEKGKVYSGDIPDIQDMKIEDIDTLPSMIFDSLLGSFDILKEGDILVSPIAIYYE